MSPALHDRIMYGVFLFFFGYFVLMIVYYFGLALVGFYQGRKRSEEYRDEDYGIISSSAFSIPVSFIVPAHNEEDWIADSLKALINIRYPEFEIIVVNDASTDRTAQILNEILDLRSDDIHYRCTLENCKAHEILRSERYPHVTVLNRSGRGRKAGALNAGLSIARYKYVCAIDADTILEPDCLLNVMAHVEKDPERIIGVGSYFGLVNGFKIKDGKILHRSFSYNPLIAYQNIEYLRVFIGNRLTWSACNAIPIVSGGFALWRRDILFELGAYDSDFTCEDMEFTFRVYDYIVKQHKPYRVLSLPYHVAWTDGPSNLRSLLIQRERWQRVTNETIWRYRHMFFNPRYGWFGFLTFPYFVLYEVLGVYIEIASIAVVASTYIAGILDIKTFLAYLALMAFSQTIVSTFVLFAFLHDQKIFRFRYLAYLYLILLTAFEFVLYRWILSVAKITGTVKYFMGIKTFDQYRRTANVHNTR